MPSSSSEILAAATPPGKGDVVIELENVGVRYRRRRGLRPTSDFWALENVSLQLRQGETLGVIGRNGAGKSTLLRILAHILKPDRGEFRTVGLKATLLSLALGFIPYLSGRENVILSAMFLGMSRREIERLMPSIFEFAGLGSFIDEPISTYSSGMRARLGFSAAFQIEPDILLIDEVLGVGDVEFITKSKEVMKEKIRSDMTVVLASHNHIDIAQLCDRAVWIERGVSIMEGPAREVVNEYRNRVVLAPGFDPADIRPDTLPDSLQVP